MNVPNKIINLINNSKNIAIFCHINADGDTLGSASALSLAFSLMGKKSNIFCDSVILPHLQVITNYNKLNKQTIKKYDLAIAVDVSGLKRLGQNENLYLSIPNKIQIDHHIKEEMHADYNWIVDSASSAAVMSYHLIKRLGVKINKNIARDLFFGISSDTISFSVNTKHTDFEVAAELVKTGFDLEKTTFYLSRFKTKVSIKLLKNVFGNINFYLNDKLIILCIENSDLKKSDAIRNDGSGFINYITGVEGAEIACVVSEEKPNVFIGSLRSWNGINVQQVAKRLGGGGHKPASGFKFYGNKDAVLKAVIKSCEIELCKD